MSADSPAFRNDRLHSEPSPLSDRRTPSEHDRDRILYTFALRRLAGVTQVVGPLEGHIFHNRLTHTHEVAQLSRRLCQQLKHDYPKEATALCLDEDVAEAAALAHDLGHPPFGHIAEKTLNKLAQGIGRKAHNREGFEGNAQSFRIVTYLADHRHSHRGLNLTRATLNAILKYPWFHDGAPKDKPTKYGAYYSEKVDFSFARKGDSSQHQSPEAAIMDIADAVAYSIHDLEDFIRVGLIPLHTIVSKSAIEAEIEEFVGSNKTPEAKIRRHADAITELFDSIPFAGYYAATRENRANQRAAGSLLITNFLKAVSIRPNKKRRNGYELNLAEREDLQMRFMQNLVWRHVIMGDRLATQQHGQERIIEDLFEVYSEAIQSERLPLIPPFFQEEVQALIATGAGEAKTIRVAVDIVAGLAENQATALHRRLTGVVTGSVSDFIS